MFKRLLKMKSSLVFAFSLFVSLVASAQTQITDEAGLKAIANDLTGNYVLTGDITLTSEWVPIGTSTTPFTGSLDGKGHSINGLTISTGVDNVGFFGFTQGATITDVRFIGANVSGNHQAGVVAGQAISSTITKVFTSGVVTGYDHIGGIIGDARGDANNGNFTTLENCMSIAGAFSTTHQGGGIAGWTNAGVFKNDVFMGSATAPGNGAGGILPITEGPANVMNCVSAPAFLSGATGKTHSILGFDNGGPVVMNNNISSEGSQFLAGGQPVAVADLFAENADWQGTVVPSADLTKAATYAALNLDATVWTVADGQYPALVGMTFPLKGDGIAVNKLPSKCILNKEYSSNAMSALNRTISIVSSNPAAVLVDGNTLKFVGLGTAEVTYTTSGDAFAEGATLKQTITVADMNYNLSTVEDLKNMSNNLAGDFKLMNDIDLAGVDWTPLGTFTGTFDGQGHVIKNMKITKNSSVVGFFTKTQNATIQNLGFENANVVGTDQDVAVIVGQLQGSVLKNCYVANSFVQGRDHVGALAGMIRNVEGLSEDDPNLVGGNISDCMSDAQVKSTSYQAGGLVGVSRGGIVERCIFSGTVDCPDNATGIVSLVDKAANDANGNQTIATTFIRNNFVGASHLYGNVTRIVAPGGRSVILENNYVLASTYTGTNAANAGTMDNQTDPTTVTGANIDDATAKTTAFYTSLGFDFTNNWKFLDTTEGKMFPVLKWVNAPLPSSIFDMPQNKSILFKDGVESINLNSIHGSWGQTLSFDITSGSQFAEVDGADLYAGVGGTYGGSGDVNVSVSPASDISSLFTMTGNNSFSVFIGQSGSVTEISTVADLAKILKNLEGKYKLTADLDLSGVAFAPIGDSNSQFVGELDGQGHKIKNLTINSTTGTDIGFFSYVNGATIKNIAFENAHVYAPNQNHVGILAGTLSSATIDQVAVNGFVVGNDHVAGMAGDGNAVTITNSYVDANISGYSQVGGFFGCSTGNLDISTSYFNGIARATTRGWVGGFIGLVDKSNSTITIKNCVSLGNITSVGSGSPHAVNAFIGGNNAGDTPNATIFFTSNIANDNAVLTVDGDNSSAWPTKNPTVDGGDIQDPTRLNNALLQVATPYTGLGWDFSSVWSIDPTSGYVYPVLKLFGTVSTGIQNVENGTSVIAVSASNNLLTVSGLTGASMLRVVTVSGQQVAGVNTTQASATVKLPGKGLYVVAVTNNGVSKSYKVVNK